MTKQKNKCATCANFTLCAQDREHKFSHCFLNHCLYIKDCTPVRQLISKRVSGVFEQGELWIFVPVSQLGKACALFLQLDPLLVKNTKIAYASATGVQQVLGRRKIEANARSVQSLQERRTRVNSVPTKGTMYEALGSRYHSIPKLCLKLNKTESQVYSMIGHGYFVKNGNVYQLRPDIKEMMPEQIYADKEENND